MYVPLFSSHRDTPHTCPAWVSPFLFLTFGVRTRFMVRARAPSEQLSTVVDFYGGFPPNNDPIETECMFRDRVPMPVSQGTASSSPTTRTGSRAVRRCSCGTIPWTAVGAPGRSVWGSNPLGENNPNIDTDIRIINSFPGKLSNAGPRAVESPLF